MCFRQASQHLRMASSPPPLVCIFCRCQLPPSVDHCKYMEHLQVISSYFIMFPSQSWHNITVEQELERAVGLLSKQITDDPELKIPSSKPKVVRVIPPAKIEGKKENCIQREDILIREKTADEKKPILYMNDTKRETEEKKKTIVMKVTGIKVPTIIGVKGKIINELRTKTGASIKVLGQKVDSVRKVVIQGSMEATRFAEKEVSKILNDTHIFKITLSRAEKGMIIGPFGRTLKRLVLNSGASIYWNRENCEVSELTIWGTEEKVMIAKEEVKRILEENV